MRAVSPKPSYSRAKIPTRGPVAQAVWLRADLAERVDAAAVAAGETRSEFIRRAALARADDVLGPVVEDAADPEPLPRAA